MAQRAEKIIRTHRVQSRSAVGRILSGVLGLVLVAMVGPRQAEGTLTILAPEETRVLEVADGATCELVVPPQRTDSEIGADCVNQSPTPSCVADAAARTLKVDAGLGTVPCISGFNPGGIYFPGGPVRSAAGIGRLINTIAIEAPATQPAAVSFPVQISTEVQWDGVLFPVPFVLPVQSQVIATLQVRDTTTGEVVASDTFFFERSGPTSFSDSLSDLPCSANGCNSNPFDFLVALNNGTGVDLIAELLRDREYAIEVEAKCEHTANYSHPALGLRVVVGIAGGCFFGGEQNEILNDWAGVFADALFDGFSVGPITVTVGTDLAAKLNLCPNSDRSPTVVIDGCDSGVTNTRLDDGCTMADEIAACAAEAARHGDFVSCVAALTNAWKSDGLISGREKGAIQRCAARADLP